MDLAGLAHIGPGLADVTGPTSVVCSRAAVRRSPAVAPRSGSARIDQPCAATGGGGGDLDSRWLKTQLPPIGKPGGDLVAGEPMRPTLIDGHTVTEAEHEISPPIV